MINIAGTRPVDDPAYRYQMPRLQTKIEGRGNGIKTVVVNMNEIAQALHRDPAEVTKFFGCELGAQTAWSDDTLKSVVNGAHQAADMQTHLSRYIESFVLCSHCRLPETQYKVKTDTIFQKCAACGAKEPVDMSHKLTTFIANSYKKAKKEKGEADKKAKKERKGKDDKKGSSSSSSSSKKRDAKEKKPKKKRGSEEDDDDEDGVAANGSDDIAESKADVNGDADEDADGSGDVLEVDDREALDAAVARFRSFLCDHPSASLQEMGDELHTLQTFSALRNADKIIIYIAATFDESAIASNAVQRHKQALSALSQRDGRVLIAAMEWLCGVKYPQLKRLLPVAFKQLYDEDLVEEEQFLAWEAEGVENEYSSPSLDQEVMVELRVAVTPFLHWLKNAEEEGEGEGGEEEDGDDDEDA